MDYYTGDKRQVEQIKKAQAEAEERYKNLSAYEKKLMSEPPKNNRSRMLAQV